MAFLKNRQMGRETSPWQYRGESWCLAPAGGLSELLYPSRGQDRQPASAGMVLCFVCGLGTQNEK